MSKNRMVLKILSWFMVLAFVFGSGSAGAQNVSGKAPDFTLSSMTGESHQLSQYQGKNPVLLVFFATWCPPCQREVPDLIELQNKYAGKGLKIFAVNVNEPQDVVEQFAREKGINYTVLLDSDAAVADQYEVRGIPTNVLIDRKGDIQFIGHSIPGNIEEVL